MTASDDLAVGAMVARAIMEKSVKQFLEPREELRVAFEVRRMSRLSRWLSACLDISPPPAELPKKMAVAVTDRRLLVLEAGGRLAEEAKGLLLEVPVGRVSSVASRGGINMTTVTWTADGRGYTLLANRPDARALAAALAPAVAN